MKTIKRIWQKALKPVIIYLGWLAAATGIAALISPYFAPLGFIFAVAIGAPILAYVAL